MALLYSKAVEIMVLEMGINLRLALWAAKMDMERVKQ